MNSLLDRGEFTPELKRRHTLPEADPWATPKTYNCHVIIDRISCGSVHHDTSPRQTTLAKREKKLFEKEFIRKISNEMGSESPDFRRKVPFSPF